MILDVDVKKRLRNKNGNCKICQSMKECTVENNKGKREGI